MATYRELEARLELINAQQHLVASRLDGMTFADHYSEGCFTMDEVQHDLMDLDYQEFAVVAEMEALEFQANSSLAFGRFDVVRNRVSALLGERCR